MSEAKRDRKGTDHMTREEMIAVVQAEITKIEQIRELMAKSHSQRFTLPEPAASAGAVVKKRVFSPEARRSIAQAQARRWAKLKRETVAPAEAN